MLFNLHKCFQPTVLFTQDSSHFSITLTFYFVLAKVFVVFEKLLEFKLMSTSKSLDVPYQFR